MPILPVVNGENSRLQDKSQGAFQVQRAPGGGYSPPKYLRSIVDLLVASDGALTTRPGAALLAALAGVKSFYNFAGSLYIHQGTVIKRRVLATGVTTTAATGISITQPTVWCEHQGMLRWTDGTASGRFTADGALILVLPQAPAPALTTASGALPTGKYLVSVTWLDAVGAQSGCAESATIDLNGTQSIVVTPGAFPIGAVSARLWCSRANEAGPVLVGDYIEGQYPVTISATPTGSIQLRTQGLYPLPPGSGLTVRGGFLLSWSGSTLAFSAGDWTNLYDPRVHAFSFPATILGAAGVNGGVWVSTPAGMYWIAGADLTKASVTGPHDNRVYAAGAALLPPALTGIQSSDPVAVFASDVGLVFGTSDGALSAPMYESQRWSVSGKTASFAVWEYGGEKFIVVGGIE